MHWTNAAGETALLRAAAGRSSLGIIRVLLREGSDPFAVDRNQHGAYKTLLQWICAHGGCRAMVKSEAENRFL
ncbi:hypothetical protein JKP88DRAFT_287744 [Tribonema minus]|uniref:Uncharacterized protein n=1 Tax=Tribonema minus TaxID=303371 RepID=A0A836CJV1_9STRA|nr:hypothetical protein JKP88DRAFT_287744 [Tribonema minus]